MTVTKTMMETQTVTMTDFKTMTETMTSVRFFFRECGASSNLVPYRLSLLPQRSSRR
jgi:hypothetical protein